MIAKTLIFHALSVFPIFNDHPRISSLLSLFYTSYAFHAQIRFFRPSLFTLKSDFFIFLSSLFSLLSSFFILLSYLMLRPLPFLVLLT
jgi:hypothetical protein